MKPPAFRFDISIEADLLEELVRIHGYNQIPRTRPARPARDAAGFRAARSMAVIRQRLVERGYFEAITYSFVDPRWQQVLDPQGHGSDAGEPDFIRNVGDAHRLMAGPAAGPAAII